MIDLSKQKWDLMPLETKIINILDSKGYDVAIKKQWQTKDVFIISKDGVETILEITSEMYASKADTIVSNFEQRFEDLVLLQHLRQKAKEQGIID